jgi:DNA-binding transcriptional LysR family regulator
LRDPDLITKALDGHLGFAKMPEFVVSQAIKDGGQEVVLPDWAAPETELFLVVSNVKKRLPSHAALLRAIFENLERCPGIKVLVPADSLHN